MVSKLKKLTTANSSTQMISGEGSIGAVEQFIVLFMGEDVSLAKMKNKSLTERLH